MDDLKDFSQSDGTQETLEVEVLDERRSRSLDIPVDSWDAYKSWCEKVKENWEED